jgi:L-fuculose-phosphate aldolase
MGHVKSIREELQHTGKFMMEYGLAWGNSGNISARVDESSYVITGSGTFLGELEEEDLIECSLSGKKVSTLERRPSKETPMHSAVYGSRPEINAVLHASPFYSTLIACSNLEIPSNWFIETMYYLERVERVPYYHPGSEELGLAVKERAKKANILILENHGVLVYDVSIKEARMALQTLEMTCRMLVESRAADIKLGGLSQKIQMDFLNNAGYKPRRVY